MIYAAFALWIFAIVFTARGTLNILSGMTKPRIIAWTLLPGTIVAEMGYFFACLLTGAEFQGKKLIDTGEGKSDNAAQTRGGVPYLTSLLTGLLPLATCLALIYLICEGFNHPGYQQFQSLNKRVPQDLPQGAAAVFTSLRTQVDLLQAAWQAAAESLAVWPWNNWKAWLLQYLMLCLTLRMAPARRPMRPTLAGAAVFALITAGIVAAFSSQAKWLHKLWPIVSYTWATALMLLAITLLVAGIMNLVRVLGGKTPAKSSKST